MDVALPVSLADSVAAVTMARATTARRRSSADGLSSLTNAVTSQEDIKMRALPILTVVMERPRVGGTAINCSQICSRQDSKVQKPRGLADFLGASGTERVRAAVIAGYVAMRGVGCRVMSRFRSPLAQSVPGRVRRLCAKPEAFRTFR